MKDGQRGTAIPPDLRQTKPLTETPSFIDFAGWLKRLQAMSNQSDSTKSAPKSTVSRPMSKYFDGLPRYPHDSEYKSYFGRTADQVYGDKYHGRLVCIEFASKKLIDVDATYEAAQKTRTA